MPLASRVTDLGPFDLLLSVARLGSVGAAARHHGISQPAASSRIRHLERRLGLQLLARSPQGSHLTEHGALVADWAKTALDAADAMEAGIASLHHTAESRLPVAASLTIAEYLLPHWLVRFHRRVPGTTAALTTGNSDEVAAAVLADRVGIGFVEGPTLPRGLSAQTVGHDELLVITHPRHPWARRRSGISAAELAATPLVSRERGSGTRLSLERALRAHTDTPPAPPLLELSSTTAIKTAVAEAVAPAVLSSLAVSRELDAGTVVAVPVAGLDLTRRLRVIHRSHAQIVGAARELVAIACTPERLRDVPRSRGL
ncbi:LysR family transcriptional regulator [Streptomyces sp. TG1A-8]|uniref:LysR family transcriptional regulator n=1 Tax=Streptomyces sp. TG1A-8 TaxID=3051385 RepID=UPI00265BAD31|nr:LysR family transcriptional regulator [Streptomyces sp. TG1A-8]MDO0924025.1 LysR family transcriptional regulator [Streptomyces sp. TG1A-8]